MWQRVSRKSLSEGVFEQLRDRILAGDLAVGERVPAERVLCEALGVNRGALREALRRLEQSGLISVRHGGSSEILDYRRTGGLELLCALHLRDGWRAGDPENPPGDQPAPSPTLLSALEARAALQPPAGRLAALHIHPEWMAPLENAAVRLDAPAPPSPETLDLQLRFWSGLVDASESVAFQLADNSLRAVLQMDPQTSSTLLGPERDVRDGHQRLVEAIIGGEVDGAEEAARALVQRGAAVWRRFSGGPR